MDPMSHAVPNTFCMFCRAKNWRTGTKWRPGRVSAAEWTILFGKKAPRRLFEIRNVAPKRRGPSVPAALQNAISNVSPWRIVQQLRVYWHVAFYFFSIHDTRLVRFGSFSSLPGERLVYLLHRSSDLKNRLKIAIITTQGTSFFGVQHIK